MADISITAIILTKNEENSIERCMKSVEFCSEIVVIDDYSTDKTVELAKQYTKNVVQRHLNNDFTAQRNFGLSLAKSEWILFVDADEAVSAKLMHEILMAVHGGTLTKKAYFIPRRDYWWGKEIKYGEVLEARKKGFIRFVKKNSGQWMGKVHERFAINAVVGSFKHYLNHYPHPTIKEFLSEVNHYSTIRAQELKSMGVKPSITHILLYPLGKFLWTYFLRLGFLDGSAGFAYSFFMSFHSFLVRSKLYQYSQSDATT
jgi:glycosyltransferase involved in cell wall biosynthesis